MKKTSRVQYMFSAEEFLQKLGIDDEKVLAVDQLSTLTRNIPGKEIEQSVIVVLLEEEE